MSECLKQGLQLMTLADHSGGKDNRTRPQPWMRSDRSTTAAEGGRISFL